jgi:predicted esterase
MTCRALLASLFGLASCMAVAGDAAGDVAGLHRDMVFDQYPDFATSSQLLRRLVSPLNAQRIRQQAHATGITIREQPIDLSKERFTVYVPAHAPPEGYALMVFVPPWDEAKIPLTWIPVLERRGIVLVTAAGSGNDEDVLDRREPLALLGAANAMSRYHIDPRRVFIGGFSGGSRVALRLALGYADVFHGVLLEAGSDVLGQQLPPPPRELLEQFQASTRVVYLTGATDTARQQADRQSRQSLKHWCITDIDARTIPWTGHEIADPSAFDRALESLDRHVADDTATLTACRARIEKDLDEQLDAAEASLAGGDSDHARSQLQDIDLHFGGLAAPRSVDLASRLNVATSK